MGEKVEDDEYRYLFGEFCLQEDQKYRIVAGRGGKVKSFLKMRTVTAWFLYW